MYNLVTVYVSRYNAGVKFGYILTNVLKKHDKRNIVAAIDSFAVTYRFQLKEVQLAMQVGILGI